MNTENSAHKTLKRLKFAQTNTLRQINFVQLGFLMQFRNWIVIYNVRKQPPEVFCKKRCSEKFGKFHRKTSVLESLFNKFSERKANNFIKKRLQNRCFPVKFAKFLRTPILKNICEWLLLYDCWITAQHFVYSSLKNQRWYLVIDSWYGYYKKNQSVTDLQVVKKSKKGLINWLCFLKQILNHYTNEFPFRCLIY